MKKNLINQIYIKELNQIYKVHNLLETKIPKNFEILCKKSLKAVKNNKKIIFFGNGGSASDSMHLATELVVRYKKKRRAINAISLSSNIGAVTAIANDFNFKQIFSRQLEACAQKGDILISLTTSGNSKNIIEAGKLAKKKKLEHFSLVGNKGGKIKNYCTFPIIIPSSTTSIIQIYHITLGHIFCEFLEKSV
jgi:D-sedoheptulose 7-phosphate isomerase